jgi:hypothetical protein
MRIRTSLAALTVLVAVAFSSAVVLAATQSMTLYAGATLTARMNQALSSGSANVGDTITMTVTPPYPSGDPVYRDATITAVVTKVQRAGQGTKPEIAIHLRYLRLTNGITAQIYGKVTQAQQQENTAETVGKTALGAIGGMLVGNAIGKTLFQASGGGAVGAVGGALLGANNKTNFTIPAGSTATLKITQTVTIRRQS